MEFAMKCTTLEDNRPVESGLPLSNTVYQTHWRFKVQPLCSFETSRINNTAFERYNPEDVKPHHHECRHLKFQYLPSITSKPALRFTSPNHRSAAVLKVLADVRYRFENVKDWSSVPCGADLRLHWGLHTAKGTTASEGKRQVIVGLTVATEGRADRQTDSAARVILQNTST
jgi:hypothetical protein